MPKLTLLVIVQFFALSLLAQVTKVQNFQIDGSSILLLNIGAEMEIEEWVGDNIVVEMTIEPKAEDGNSSFALDYAMKKGYFDLVSKVEQGFFTLERKKVNASIFSNGALQKSTAVYKILVPSGIQYQKSQVKLSML